jgi:hypothetical protein
MRQSLPMIFGGARESMFPLPHRPRRNRCLLRHFRLGQVSFDAFQQQVIAQSFRIDGNELPATISLLGMVIFNRYGTLCNTQQLTQSPLALSVPLSRFTSRVGGGSAFYVRHRSRHECFHHRASAGIRAIPFESASAAVVGFHVAGLSSLFAFTRPVLGVRWSRCFGFCAGARPLDLLRADISDLVRSAFARKIRRLHGLVVS